MIEFCFVTQQIPTANGIRGSASLDTGDKFGLHDKGGKECHLISVYSADGKSPSILEVHELGTEAKPIPVRVLVLRAPRNINRVGEEGLLEELIKCTAGLSVDLDLEGLGLHENFVFICEAGIAKSKIVVRDHGLVSASGMDGIVNEFTNIDMTHLGRMEVTEPSEAVDIVDGGREMVHADKDVLIPHVVHYHHRVLDITE